MLFGEKTRHTIQFTNKDSLREMIQSVINPAVVNAICCNFPVLACIQDDLVRTFPSTKFWHYKNIVTDIFDDSEKKEIVVTEHNCAHRAAQENVKQILADYYFSKMSKLANETVQDCKICSKAKYVRHPNKQELGETPIPCFTGEMQACRYLLD